MSMMTFDLFKESLECLNGGGNFDSAFLERVYNAVILDPITTDM